MQDVRIRCPKCDWEPDDSCIWMCTVCKTRWNTFTTKGCCPTCGKVYEETQCIRRKGGCDEMSPHLDWYEKEEVLKSDKQGSKINWFWKNRNKPPITKEDKIWVATNLLWLAELFEPVYFKSLITITPDNIDFDRYFTGAEADAQFILEKLTSLMRIDLWEIQLMFFSNRPTEFSEGIVATPSDKIKGSWNSPTGKYVDNGLGHKEIWVELDQIKDPSSLIATMAHELANLKLLYEYQIEKKDVFLADLTTIAFGFGIFMGNSYFKFSQWTGTTHQGWNMRRTGYLPEQVMAYAMAWLAHYRNEDIEWKQYLNRPMKKYFERSFEYIKQNIGEVKGLRDFEN